MAFFRSNLISRQGYSGMGGLMDDISGAVGAVVNFYGREQQAVGAQAQAAQSNRDLTAALAAQGGGISTETIVIFGGVAVAAYLMLRKKKAT